MTRKALTGLYALLLLAALAYAVISQRDALREGLSRISLATLLGALIALLVGLVLSMLSWRAVLAEVGSPLPVPVAARIFYVGQLGKYLPGSVWPLLTQMAMGKAAGVPRTRMGAAGLVALGLSVVTGAVAGVLCLPALGGGAYVVATVVLIVVGLVALHPRVLNAILATGLRLARREPLEQPLRLRGVALGSGYLLACWAAFGVQAWLLVRAVGGSEAVALPLSVGAFALASTLGLLFLLAPAGAGVREAVLVLGLAPVLSAGEATTVALVSRLLVTVADGLVAGGALLVARRAAGVPPIG